MRWALVGCLVSSSVLAAATDFSAGSWIIPMDACFQNTQSFDGNSFSGSNETSTFYATCPDRSTASGHDGILKAYGLVYRLLQRGIPVYYILNPIKTAVDDTDLAITNNASTPVKRLSHTTWNTSEFMNNAHHTISYRGAPFIISAADTATVLNLLKNDSDFNFVDSRTGRVVFRDVQIHVTKVNIIQAPVRAILNQPPAKVALMDVGGAAIGSLEGYLKDAGLYTATATKFYPQIGDVFTAFDDVADFTTADGLTAGGFKILWAPHWDGGNNSTTDRDDIVQKISAFLDAGNSFFAQCAAIATMEGSASNNGSGSTGATQYGHFHVDTTGTTVGLSTNNLPQQPFPAGAGDKIAANPDSSIQAWLNPMAQTGDFNLKVDVGSFTFDFVPASGLTYHTYVQRLIMSQSSTSSYDGRDLETIGYKDGNPQKGLVIYLGGHSYGSQGSSCGATCTTFDQWNMVAMERLILNSLLFLGQQPQVSERTRSAPIVYSDGKTYLGTFVQTTQSSATYPPWFGHFREYPAGALSGANVTGFSSITPNWDAAEKVAAQAAGDARKIYTAVPVSGVLTKIEFTTANLTALQAVVPTLTANTITNIRKGGLGGIDHSIPAIIQPSNVAGSTTRPVVAYVGALDGMMHAILISGTVTGKIPGEELWAFIPPGQLAKTVAQVGGVDGSATVGDAFIDTGGGTKHWRTLLGITTGAYLGTSIDVLDVTDPTDTNGPGFLWDASDSVTLNGATYVMGRAQGAAFSPVMTASGLAFAFFLLTGNTTGDAGNAFNLHALDAGTGSVLWRYNYLYTNDTEHNDVHGTVAVVDAAGDNGPATKVYFADLEGKVWGVDAATGANATVLYDAAAANGAANSVNYPIESAVVLYRDPSTSHLNVLGVTGGADWVDPAVISHVFKVDTNSPYTASNILDLQVGERVYAVPTIYGNAAYLITSKGNLQGNIGSDLSADGSLIRINLGSTGGSTVLANVKQGAAEVAVDSAGHVVAASTTGITQNNNSGRDLSQAVISLQNAAAKALSVRAWLDLH